MHEILETFVRKALHLRPSREIVMPNTWSEPTRRGASGALRQTGGAGNEPHQGALAEFARMLQESGTCNRKQKLL